jgi:hypothetical protein
LPTVKLPKARSDVAGAQVKKHTGRDWNDAETRSSDLEELEVLDAIDSLECDLWADMGENRGGGCGGAAAHIQRSLPRERGRGGRVGADGEAGGVISVQGGDLQVC